MLTPPIPSRPQGNQYWRFDDGVLDPGYPRNISDGFEGIPNNIDAAFALPAHSFHGNERVYFFKGKARNLPPTARGGRECPSRALTAPCPTRRQVLLVL